ncbi:MAG: sigma-70 family RNA polymerase sigma factor [Dehalococcoidia bacterium]|nr:sigma-70 family RNA polymerase sigma factor [Dehalococcoidia bacterium]
MREGSDEYWVGRALRDPDAFEELVERYQAKLFTLAYRMIGDRDEAADIAQETFLRAYKSLRSFRPDAKFAPWLYKIAVNRCMTHRRAQAQRPSVALDEALTESLASPDRDVERRELRVLLADAIQTLPATHRAAVILRHVHDLPYDDIAEALGVPLGTVKTWLHRGREQLQAKLALAREY